MEPTVLDSKPNSFYGQVKWDDFVKGKIERIKNTREDENKMEDILYSGFLKHRKAGGTASGREVSPFWPRASLQ